MVQTADTNKDGKIQFHELRQRLSEAGKSSSEIETIFNQYDTDGDRVLNQREQQAMKEDLEVIIPQCAPFTLQGIDKALDQEEETLVAASRSHEASYEEFGKLRFAHKDQSS
jgi:hypothetical protein